jgi:hypothetical protein
MAEHVVVRCGGHALLFPAENIGLIEPAPASLAPRAPHDPRADEIVIDLRRLLDVADLAPVERCVTLRWRSTDGAREATILVDAVEEIVDCRPLDLISTALLPARLRPLCDHVMRDGRGGLRLRVKADVALTLRGREDRRRLLASLLARRASPSGEVSP